jgi:hypothetical protein
LKELTFYSEGKQAATFQEIRERLISGIEKLIQIAQQENRIQCKEEARFVARHIFFVSSGAIRWWIASLRPDPNEGLAELRRLLKLQINGLEPNPEMKRKGASRKDGRRKISKPGISSQHGVQVQKNGNPTNAVRV